MKKALAAIAVTVVLFTTGACGGTAESTTATQSATQGGDQALPEPKELAIGDTFNDGMAKTTVQSVKVIKPNQQAPWTTVAFDVKQCASKDGFTVDFQSWTLKDKQDRRYEPVTGEPEFGGTNFLSDAGTEERPMRAGECTRGWLVYQLEGNKFIAPSSLHYYGVSEGFWGVNNNG